MPPVRRQERGRQRIEQILHAAATVFAEYGYERTTTNAVAAAAGISPGSLYQYFGNKDELVAGLAEHYQARLTTMRGTVLPDPDAAPPSVDDLLRQVLPPLVEFNLAHPGFKALFARTDMPASMREAVAGVEHSIHARVVGLLGAIAPTLDAPTLERTTTVTIQIIRGMMPLIVEAPAEERPTMLAELHTALHGYLTARITPAAGTRA